MNSGNDDDDSVRSRAVAGLRYFLCGAMICAAALLLIHAGITSFPREPGGQFPVELIAGLAGIVAFMGLLQMLIALVLRMRGHR